MMSYFRYCSYVRLGDDAALFIKADYQNLNVLSLDMGNSGPNRTKQFVYCYCHKIRYCVYIFR